LEGCLLRNAYVLINCDFGKEIDILKKLKEINSVKEVHGTFGAYDIIAEIKAEKVEKLREEITKKIRQIPSVRGTLTLMGIDSTG